MAKGKKTGGRVAGVPNKIIRIGDVAAKLEALGCDPIAGMAALARDEKATKELRGKMLSELAQYVAPKRKAIEHSGPAGDPIDTSDSAARQRIIGRIAEYAASLGSGGSS